MERTKLSAKYSQHNNFANPTESLSLIRYMMNHSLDQCTYLVAFGSNLPTPMGNPFETIDWVINRLSAYDGWQVSASRLYNSPAYPAGNLPDYANAVALVQCSLIPQEFLMFAHSLEAECGRERNHRWEPRTLDIDIIALDQNVIPSKETVTKWMEMPLPEQSEKVPDHLILPHPRMHQRGFVLLPLLDIAADWRHPILGKTVRELADSLPAEATRGISATDQMSAPNINDIIS